MFVKPQSLIDADNAWRLVPKGPLKKKARNTFLKEKRRRRFFLASAKKNEHPPLNLHKLEGANARRLWPGIMHDTCKAKYDLGDLHE